MKTFGEKNVNKAHHYEDALIQEVDYTNSTFTVFAANMKTWGRKAYLVTARSPEDAEVQLLEKLDSEDWIIAGVVLGTVKLVG